MSICRFGEADVYVFYDIAGGITCCACSLQKKDWSSFNCATNDEMIAHLKQHVEAGDYVPQHAFDRLEEDKEDPDE